MTEEQSSTGETIDICLSEIDDSNVFLAFLGARYGWHLDPKIVKKPKKDGDKLLKKTFEYAMSRNPWIKDYMTRSVTELEVRKAVLKLAFFLVVIILKTS